MNAPAAKLPTNDIPADLIACQVCGGAINHVEKHLAAEHGEVSLDEYKRRFPGSPLTSPRFDAALKKRLEEKEQERQQEAVRQEMLSNVIPFAPPGTFVKQPMHEIFDMPLTDAMRGTNAQTTPIMLDVLVNHSEADLEAVPDIDKDFVFRESDLKDLVMSLVLNDNTYAYGLHGTGKTTVLEQICARLRRPMLRVQHTDTTEESHIIGQMLVRDGATHFEYGPLAEAMLNGWVYLADEYDVAHPGVLAVYQPVLEGKDLYIKEAPASHRRVKRHPNFRFFATGNTNGSGDDTGLYAGTKVGNAANYSRFGTTVRIDFPDKEVEIMMLRKRIGLQDDVCRQLVDFAGRVRDMSEKGEISLPISTRELLGAARKGVVLGGKFRHALGLNFMNRLPKNEAASCAEVAQRVFG